MSGPESEVDALLDAVRESYDRVAADYADLLREELAAAPVDRAVLGLYAELVQAAGGGEVVEVGCGPGRITAHLAGLGLDVRGVDLSPGMVAVARRDHPALRFEVGSMTRLDIPDGAVAGVVAWYSVIHLPTERLPHVFGELARVLRPGGQVLLAFQAGDAPARLTEAYGHPVSLVVHRRSPELVAELLTAAGLDLQTRTVREPQGREKSPQAYVIARRPTG